MSDNNPDKAALIAAYPGSDFQSRVQARAAGAVNFFYPDDHLAVGYAMDQDPVVGAQLVSRVEETVVYAEQAISNFVATGDLSSFGWIYEYNFLAISDKLLKPITFTYDLCYDLLSPEQRTRWRDVALQFVHNLRYPSNATYYSNGVGRNSNHRTWSSDPFWFTSNFAHHTFYGAVAVALAFQGEPGVTYTMPSGPVTLSGDWLLDKILTEDMPVIESQAAKMPNGGSMEGYGYGTSLHDLLQTKALYEMSTGTNLFAETAIDSYMRGSVNWYAHHFLPVNDGAQRGNKILRGASPGNPGGEVLDQQRHFLVNAIHAYPDLEYGPEIKRMITTGELGPAYTSNHYWTLTAEHLAVPAMDSITTPSDLSGMARMHAAPQAGDTVFRSDWDDASGTVLHMSTSEMHNGNHSWCDALAIQLYKNGYILANTMINTKSRDSDFYGYVPNALDRMDKRNLSLMGVGSMHETMPSPNSRDVTKELTTYNTITHFAEDNTGTDGDFYISADAARYYRTDSGSADMNKMQRDLVFFPQGIVLIFDRIETASSQTFTHQLTPTYAPSVNGTEFTVNNGTSSAVFSLLTQSSNWVSNELTNTGGESNWAVRQGQGAYQVRNVLGSGTSMSTVTAVNIDGAATSITLGSGAAGETVVVVDFADATPNKTVTFYDTQARRSIV
jgi:hypothetical protein